MLPMGKAILLGGKVKEEVGITKFDFTMDQMAVSESVGTGVRSEAIKNGLRLNGKSYDLYCTQCLGISKTPSSSLSFVFTTIGAGLPGEETYSAKIIVREECSGYKVTNRLGSTVTVRVVDGEAVLSYADGLRYYVRRGVSYVRKDAFVTDMLSAVEAAGKTYPVFKFSLVKG